MTPYEVIHACGETESKKSKMALIDEHTSKVLKGILRLALDPFTIYIDKGYELKFAEPMEHTEGFDYNWKYAVHLVKSLSSKLVKAEDLDKTIFDTSANLNGEQQDILHRILTKDLKCGVTAKMVNKDKKGIPTFKVQEAMRPEKAEVSEIAFPSMVEPIHKGIRCIILTKNKEAFYHSTDGTVLENLNKFSEEILILCGGRNLMFDCIITGIDEKDVKKKAKKKLKGKCVLLDVMPTSAFQRGACTIAQGSRIATLREIYFDSPERDTNRVKLVKGKLCNNIKDVEKYLKKMKAKGHANVIVKDLKAPYTFGESGSWIIL